MRLNSSPPLLSETNKLATSQALTAKLENAVAGMTFSNITGEPADEWIGSGIAETVTSILRKSAPIGDRPERTFEALRISPRARSRNRRVDRHRHSAEGSPAS